MRKLIVQQWVTVDNIVAEEDGGMSFVAAEPFDDSVDSPFKTSMLEFIDSVDTMILGANTYQFGKGWAEADDQGEYGRKLNNHTKYVASSMLDDAPWGEFSAATITRDPVATVRELKQQEGKHLWLWGSLTLMRSMLAAGLVDEVRMLVSPATRGKGTRLFENRQNVSLIEGTGFDNGIVVLRYAVTA